MATIGERRAARRLRGATRVRCHFLAIVALAIGLCATPAAAQSLGHRLMGTLGADAARVPEPGVYVVDQLGYYTADRVRGRDGRVLPIEGFELHAIANGIGGVAMFEIPGASTFVGARAAFPIAHSSVESERPEVRLDTWGLGDVYLSPLQLGWRPWPLDIVVGYAVYLPTDLYRLGAGNRSRGHFTHEFSAGLAVYFDRARAWRASALVSYDLNERKRGIDITRGDTIQIQGGAGATFLGIVDLGVVGYALWQVRDDRGAALPEALRGARDRTFGLGAEVGVAIPPLRMRLVLRYARDLGLGVEARPEGHVIVFSAAWRAWTPD